MIFGESVRLSIAGIVLGVLIAFWAANGMRTLLADLSPGDLLTYGAAVGVCLVMTVIGSALPALRALAVDPASVIRVE
jgi:ABC-type antimicrobial peptide transport system permease subunit